MHLGGIDLNMDLARPGRVRAQFASHSIIETHAKGQQKIRILDGVISISLAMHAHHIQTQIVRSRDGPKAQ